MKFKIEKKSSSKIKFKNQFREIEISKNQVQIDRGNDLNSPSHLTSIQENFICSNQGTFPISLVRSTRKFGKAKAIKNILICHWPSETFQFIRFKGYPF